MSSDNLTVYLIFVVFSILLASFQYGHHNGELNTPQSVISKCQEHAMVGLPKCIPMSDSSYSLVVSILTLGGLIGALGAPHFTDRYGRRWTLISTNILLGIGSLWLTVSRTWFDMMFARFLIGLGSGVVTVVVPAYIAECVPAAKRGMFGALNQLFIVIGIMEAQIISLSWSTIDKWRWILSVGFFLAILGSILLMFCVDSPRFLATLPNGHHRAKASLIKLRRTTEDEVEQEMSEWITDPVDNHIQEEEEQMLLPDNTKLNHVNVWKFLKSKEYRRPLCIVLLLQLSQQLSGINAVIFYSTSIMSSVFPESSGMITVYISVVNLVVTIISAGLMDKAGRRTLFLISASCMTSMGLLLGWSMEHGQDKLSAFAIIGFVASFAIGLGPIPFLMIPELVETKAVSSACSIGLACNMIANFFVSAGFLKLRQLLGQGQVFYLFGSCLALLVLIAFMILPETKGRSPENVIQSGYSIYPSEYEEIAD